MNQTTTIALVLAYVWIGAAVVRAVRCAHWIGCGQDVPRFRAIKCGLFWPWYVATWSLQALYEAGLMRRKDKNDPWL